MKLKDIKGFVVALLFVQLGFAQQTSFKVIDAQTSLPLEDVQVVISGRKHLGITNANGQLLVRVKQPKIHVTLFHYGYDTVEKDLVLNGEKEVLLKMVPLKEELSTVVLNAKKRIDYAITTLKPVVGTHIYAGKKTEVVNVDLVGGSKSTNNPRQIFSKVAGLNIYDSNDGGLQLNIGGRGLDPNRTANFNTRQNDYDISADVLGYPESYYTTPSEALEQIQVIRGAASLQYGTQFGGLINFITHKPSEKPIEFLTRNTAASFKTYTNFTSLSGTVGKFSYYTYYNYKQGEGFRPNSDYNSNNLFVHLGYKFNDAAKIAFEMTDFDYVAHQPGGLSDFEFLQDPTQSYLTRNWFGVDWRLYNLKYEHQLTDVSKLTVSLFALDASRKAVGYRGDPTQQSPRLFRNNGAEVDQQQLGNYGPRDLLIGDFKNYGAEVRFLSNYDIGNNTNYYLLGAKVYNANNAQKQGGGSRGTDADFNFSPAETNYPNQNDFKFPNFNTSIFGEHIFNINKHLSITPGFRFEHIKTESEGSYYAYNYNTPSLSVTIDDNNSFVRNFVLLGLGVSYKPSRFLELYANASQNYRSVTFSDIRTINPSFIIDENITDEKGFNVDLGIRGKIKKAFSYDANVFGLYYDNRIGQVLNSRAQWVRKNIGTAFIYGVESLLQWNLKETFFKETEDLKLEVFSNLSLTQSEYIASEENGIEGNEVEFIPFMNLKTGISFGWKDVLANLQYTYVSEQYTDVTNSPYSATNSSNVIGAIPSYDILDFSMSYQISKNFKLEGGVNNVLDKSYFTRRATGYPGPGIIPAEPRYFYTTLEIKF
ncbi:TonB-dependent receptor domain-containing protein [Wenyingzhuangia sp. IMCC45574]